MQAVIGLRLWKRNAGLENLNDIGAESQFFKKQV